MANPQFASLAYFTDNLILVPPAFALPTGVPGGGVGAEWDKLGLPDIAARIAGSPQLYVVQNTAGRSVGLRYSLTVDLTSVFVSQPTFYDNFPTAKARVGALANLLTLWLEAKSGAKWHAETPVFYDDIATILGASLHRRWRADTNVLHGGGSVTQWTDSVAAIVLAEANPVNEPGYQATNQAFNDQPMVFAVDAASDLSSGVLPAQAQPFETFALALNLGGGTGVLFSGDAPGVSEVGLNAGVVSYTTDGVAILTDPVAVPANQVTLVDALANGVNSRLQVDDRAAIVGDAGAGAPVGFVMLNDATKLVGIANAAVAELFACDPVTDAQRTEIQAYMTGRYRWNLAVPPP